MKTPRSVLERISEFDPDGMDFGEYGPANSDRFAFKQKVLNVYGPQAWADYNSDWAKGAGTYE